MSNQPEDADSDDADTDDAAEGGERAARAERRVRADAKRNLAALLEAAKTIFAKSGVEAPVREIAEKAQVGIGTFYRHFPQRSDLIAAVFRHEIDACAEAATSYAAEHAPGEALAMWMQRYAAFIATKRGLAPALHSGNPAFESLRGYFEARVRPAMRVLLEAAIAAGEACACPPKMMAGRSAWLRCWSTDCAARCPRRSRQLPAEEFPAPRECDAGRVGPGAVELGLMRARTEVGLGRARVEFLLDFGDNFAHFRQKLLDCGA
jgi:AcrR family transcriptional regulator